MSQSRIYVVDDFENLPKGTYNVGDILVNAKSHLTGVYNGKICEVVTVDTPTERMLIEHPELYIKSVEDNLKYIEKQQEDKTEYIKELIKLKKSLDNILVKYI